MFDLAPIQSLVPEGVRRSLFGGASWTPWPTPWEEYETAREQLPHAIGIRLLDQAKLLTWLARRADLRQVRHVGEVAGWTCRGRGSLVS
jgi:hypothetical protein